MFYGSQVLSHRFALGQGMPMATRLETKRTGVMSPGPHFTLELERSDRTGARGAAEKESEPHAKGLLSSLHPHERGFAGSHFDRTNLDRVPCFSSATRCGSLLLRYGRISRKAIGSSVKIFPAPARVLFVIHGNLASPSGVLAALAKRRRRTHGGAPGRLQVGPVPGRRCSQSHRDLEPPIRIGTFRRL